LKVPGGISVKKNACCIQNLLLKGVNVDNEDAYRLYFKEKYLMLDPTYRYWLKKGRLEGRLDVARNLLAEGFPIEKVVKFTGLSKEDILNGK